MKKYFASVNLLRAIAVLLVCTYHFTNMPVDGRPFLGDNDTFVQLSEYGANGVFMFFVISGFVLPISMFNGSYSVNKSPQFIARRVVRLQLPYIASIFGFLFFHYINCRLYMWNFEINGWQFFHHLYFYIEFTDYDWYNVVFWTLAIEFQYYILIAFLFPLFSSANKNLQIISIIAFIVSGLFLSSHSLVFYYAPIFALGIIVYLHKSGSVSRFVLIMLSILALVVMANLHDWAICLFSLTSALFITFFNVNIRLFKKLGEISYSLYLVHGLIGGNLIFWFGDYFEGYWNKVGFIIGLLILSIISSYFFWYLFERPAQSLSRKIEIKGSKKHLVEIITRQ